MLPLTRKYKFKVPNTLAVFAALLLLGSSMAGLNHAGLSKNGNFVVQANADAGLQTPSKVQAAVPIQSKKNKGFKMSLFLFRNH